MRKIEHRTWICLLIAGLLAAGLLVFIVLFFKDGGQWASASFNRHLYSSSGSLLSGRLLDREGNVLSQVEDGARVISGSAEQRTAMLHVTGDLQGKIATGALTVFADRLTGYNPVLGAAAIQAGGGDVTLSIDSGCQLAAWRALNGRKGAAALYNYETGEILCMVSAPSYDPLNVPDNLERDPAYEGAYINRVLRASFTPGSIMKTVTLHAAMEELPDLFDRTWTCTGSTNVGGEAITCPHAHGEMDIYDALANSCNGVFGQLAAELGPEVMAKYTQKAGLTSSYKVSGLTSAAGRFDFTGTTGQLAWAGVGQYNDLANPCAIMTYMGAIANGGKAAVPRLILKVENPLGLPSLPQWTSKTGTLIESSTAATLADIMSRNVIDAYGSGRFPNMDICAKSGTAEVGGGNSPHAWFAGFLRNEDAPYAFVVLVENGGSGADVAGSVAAQVLDALVNGY